MTTSGGQDITLWAVVSAFGGTIIGAVLGGLISYFLQRKSLAATAALHDSDRKELRKALGYGLLFKMIRLSSDLSQLGMPIEEALSNARTQGKSEEFWSLILPVLPLPDPIKFSADEMALVLSLDNKLFNDMAALDDLHKSAIVLFDLYAKKRAALTDTLRPEAIAGNLGTVLLTRAERDRIRPHSAELDILIRAMLERTIGDGKIAWNCLSRLHQALEKEFDLKHELELKEEYKAAFRGAAATSAGTQAYYHHYKG